MIEEAIDVLIMGGGFIFICACIGVGFGISTGIGLKTIEWITGEK